MWFNVKEITMERKDYCITYTQRFMGQYLDDTIIKRNKTVAEMEEAVRALYTDTHVLGVYYAEIRE